MLAKVPDRIGIFLIPDIAYYFHFTPNIKVVLEAYMCELGEYHCLYDDFNLFIRGNRF